MSKSMANYVETGCFEDVLFFCQNDSSAFQMVKAFSYIEFLISSCRLSTKFETFIRKSMFLYKKKSRELEFPDANRVISNFAKFRGAKTWKEVFEAFKSIEFKENADAMLLFKLQENFEDIVLAVVSDMNMTFEENEIMALKDIIDQQLALEHITNAVELVYNGVPPAQAAKIANETFALLSEINSEILSEEICTE